SEIEPLLKSLLVSGEAHVGVGRDGVLGELVPWKENGLELRVSSLCALVLLVEVPPYSVCCTLENDERVGKVWHRRHKRDHRLFGVGPIGDFGAVEIVGCRGSSGSLVLGRLYLNARAKA